MRKSIVSLCCFILCFGMLSAQDMEKSTDSGKKMEVQKKEMTHDAMKNNGMKKQKMKKEMACPHCTKDKKCEMHADKDMNKADSTKK